MIIKSMSRKDSSFGQLLGYMNREAADEKYSFRHNCYARGQAAMETEFKRNAELLRARKNGVFMYHEILSITKDGHLTDHERKDLLRQIAERYVLMRCPNNLVYGVIHDDHSHHLHYHLMISANEVGSATRTRLSRSDFQELKAQLERRVLAEFSELAQKRSMDKQNQGERLSQRGAELKRRTKEDPPERQDVKTKIYEIFDTAIDREHLNELLQKAKMRLYVRGKNIGVVNEETDRKYRLNRLGLEDRFAILSARIERSERLEREAKQGQENATMRAHNLREAAAQELKKAKDAFDSFTGQFTPTDEAARRHRIAEEEAAERKRQEQESARQAPPEAQQEPEDPIAAARRARQEMVAQERHNRKEEAGHGLTHKR